eukprot:416324-Prymnesium_polylepis.3
MHTHISRVRWEEDLRLSLTSIRKQHEEHDTALDVLPGSGSATHHTAAIQLHSKFGPQDSGMAEGIVP